MGKARRNRNRLKLVNVSISGPKSLIPKKIFKKICGTETWEEVLQRVLGYKIPNDEGIFMCTSRYCAMNPKEGHGWRSEITETVSSYVAKFARKRHRYAVRVCSPYDVTVREKAEKSKRLNQTDDTDMSRLPNPNTKTHGMAATVPRASKRVSLLNTTSCSSDSEESITSDVSTVAAESILTSENGLGRTEFFANKHLEKVQNAYNRTQNNPLLNIEAGGCPPWNLSATAVKRLFQMSNKTLWMIKTELGSLQNTPMWDTCKTAAPMSFRALQELLREGPD